MCIRDRLIANTPVGSRISLPNEIDKLVRKWAEKISASINKMNDDSYLVAVEQQYLDKVISAKFDILDEVRKLDTEADFPVSLSTVSYTHLGVSPADINVLLVYLEKMRRGKQ